MFSAPVAQGNTKSWVCLMMIATLDEIHLHSESDLLPTLVE